MFAIFCWILLSIVGCALFTALPVVGTSILLIVSTMERWVVPIGPWVFPVSDIVLVLFLLAMGIRALLDDKNKVSGLLYILTFLSIAALVSVVFSIRPLLAAETAVRITGYAAAAYFVSQSLQNGKSLSRILWVLYGCIALSAILCVVQIAFQREAVTLHLSGGFDDWNYYPVFLAILLPFVAWQTGRAVSIRQENALIVLFYGMLLLALGTKSRSGMALVIFAFAGLAIIGLLKRNHLTWLLPVVIAVTFYLAFFQGNRNVSLSERFALWYSSPRFQERIHNNFAALSAFAHHPVTGVGAGQYEVYAKWKFPDMGYDVSSTHSSFPIVLGEMGILGGVAFVMLFCYLFTVSNRIRDAIVSDSIKTMSYETALSAIVILAVAAMIHSIHAHLFTWCFIGVLHGFVHVPSPQYSNPEKENRITEV